MKYMLLFIKDENEVIDEAALKARYARDRDLVRRAQSRREAARRRGVAAVEDSNDHPLEDGNPLVTDGPFMESKENVAGFRDRRCDRPRRRDRHHQALAVEDQTVEIRPVIPHDDMPNHPVG